MSDNTRNYIDPASPVRRIPDDAVGEQPSPGIALCLSGGGYRAMLFALGSLIRLNELRILPELRRISSVSGGSITAALLGLKWRHLNFGDGYSPHLLAEVVKPIREMASTTIDIESVVEGVLLPGTVSEWIAAKYAKLLFGEATLQDLPSDHEGPRFVINATSVQTGALWRFSKPFMGDYMVGLVMRPTVTLADAVAASSAFPPVLSPATLTLPPESFMPDARCPLQKEPYTTRVVLADGGVYDNLGLETAWKRCRTVLICDAGAKIEPEEQPRTDWALHAYRVFSLVDNQVRSLRKRQAIAAFVDPRDCHDGAYWGIRTDIGDYELPDALPAPHARTMALAAIPTRLKAIDRDLQERIINWGYAVCDAAMRKHAGKHIPENVRSRRFPYPDSPI